NLEQNPSSTSIQSIQTSAHRRQRRFREWRHRFSKKQRSHGDSTPASSANPSPSQNSTQSPQSSPTLSEPEKQTPETYSQPTSQIPISPINLHFPSEEIYEEGLIEISGKGFGFLRDPSKNFTQTLNDTFVTPEVIRNYSLRDGMRIKGKIRIGPRGRQLYDLLSIEGQTPENFRHLPVFEELTVLNPLERIRLETTADRFTTRTIDLIAPIGKGQRGLIVAPPRTGKTTILQHIAEAVLQNHPEIYVILLLVDERPEEVTELRRSLPGAEVLASSNDSDTKTHTRVSQFGIERARRLAEMGRDVIVLMDSLTRIGRAFNNIQSNKGRTMSGGVDTRALEIPRKLFASARNTAEAGSLTIIATALVETGSKMDELIFLEFKGTGNMELVLDRRIAEQRIFPAADIFLSGTRREELLLPANDLQKISIIRRGLAGHKPLEAMERLLYFLRKYPTNRELLDSIPATHH
ncbi:MAG: transcription termination factor Rho, partial [Chthoniobacterales bacterium]|nr:transcription termination factor Rho [Chthoniobacterales bacterium]